MTFFLFFLFASCILGDMAVTQEFTDYLKKHVSWEVMDYEDNVFRGWTIDEVASILDQNPPSKSEYPVFEGSGEELEESPFADKCDFGSLNFPKFTCDAAVAYVDMLGENCCLLNFQQTTGWLSVQEMYSCATCCQVI